MGQSTVVSNDDLNGRVSQIDQLVHHIDNDDDIVLLGEYAGDGTAHGEGQLLTGTSVEDFTLPGALPKSFTAMAQELHTAILSVRGALVKAKTNIKLVEAGFDTADGHSTDIANSVPT